MHRFRTIALLLFLPIPILLPAEVESKPPSYNLKVSIEPEAGSIAVQGSVEFRLGDPAASIFKFNLHETFAIKKLLVNGKDASFAYVPMESQLPLPASRGVVVDVPRGHSQGRVRMEIEYSGRMKVLSEFSPHSIGAIRSTIKSTPASSSLREPTCPSSALSVRADVL